MRIDVHTHFIPPQIIEEARRGHALNDTRIEKHDGTEWVVHPQGYRYPLSREFWDMDAKLRQMDALGIDVAVLSVSPTMFFYWADPSGAVDFCRMANETVADFAAHSKGRLHGMATVPLQDPERAASELRHAAGSLGLRGVEIGTVMEAYPLDDPRFEAFFAAAEELGAPVMLHPYYVGPKPQFRDFYMTNLIGNPLDTTIAASRLILSGFLDRHPRLSVVLVHAGGFLPYQIGRLDHGFGVRSETSAKITSPPSSYLKRFTFDTITHADLPLAFLVELVGRENVVIGTDLPFDMADVKFTERLRAAHLERAAIEAIESGNAARLYGVGPTTERVKR